MRWDIHIRTESDRMLRDSGKVVLYTGTVTTLIGRIDRNEGNLQSNGAVRGWEWNRAVHVTKPISLLSYKKPILIIIYNKPRLSLNYSKSVLSLNYSKSNFTVMLPCIVIDFFLNNQPDAIIIQNYSVMKLYMFRASSLPINRSSLLYIRHW